MKWIKCSDKLPKDLYPFHETSIDVLVKYPWGIKIGHQFNCGAWVDDHLYAIDGVTHWMPLPDDPIED